ncbi:MAG: type I-E CRISPR-associated protein Cse2/CasB [Halorhodospira sp.]
MKNAEEHPALIRYLLDSVVDDRQARAVLRRSLAAAPGTYTPAFPYVEPFLGELSAHDRQRRAAYLVAGGFALHPLYAEGRDLGAAFQQLSLRRGTGNIESRWITLLDADDDQLPERWRQAVRLLAADGIGLDWAQAYRDLSSWGHPDRFVQQRLARSFYRTPSEAATSPTQEEEA